MEGPWSWAVLVNWLVITSHVASLLPIPVNCGTATAWLGLQERVVVNLAISSSCWIQTVQPLKLILKAGNWVKCNSINVCIHKDVSMSEECLLGCKCRHLWQFACTALGLHKGKKGQRTSVVVTVLLSYNELVINYSFLLNKPSENIVHNDNHGNCYCIHLDQAFVFDQVETWLEHSQGVLHQASWPSHIPPPPGTGSLIASP